MADEQRMTRLVIWPSSKSAAFAIVRGSSVLGWVSISPIRQLVEEWAARIDRAST